MDICLIKTTKGTQILPSSIYGMLWLQTHFEEEHWDSIANEEVKIDNNDAKELAEDALEAGLMIAPVPIISSNSSKL